jgi:hypothetical protein
LEESLEILPKLDEIHVEPPAPTICGSSSGEHLEHGVDPLQVHGLLVEQHPFQRECVREREEGQRGEGDRSHLVSKSRSLTTQQSLGPLQKLQW